MTKKNKNIKLKSVQEKRLNVFVLFLFLSFLISLLVKLSNNYTQTLNFEFSPTGLKSNEVIISEVPKSINVTISGRGFELLKYYIEKPVIEVDFTQLRKNNTQYVWSKSEQLDKIINHFDSKIVVKSINPDTVFFPFDSQFIKKVPVMVIVNPTFAVGFDLIDDFRSSPDSITVTGPESMLKIINSVSTKKIELNEINSAVDFPVELNISPSLSQLNFSHQSVSVVANVGKFTEGMVNVPVTIVNVPEDLIINFFPKEISVVFYSSLEAYANINEADFIVECDFNLLTADNNYLNPVLVKQPLDVKTAQLKITQLEFIITSTNE
ncbi:CdaR family protein [Flavobacteriaceae bacterium]|nr:CdaR family protein [Flavobacteriaceae bacterium]